MPQRNPALAVDVIIQTKPDTIVLIRRKNEPFGWAIPGGFVDYGESLEQAAVREAREETTLEVTLIRQMHTYSEPSRDPRGHTVSAVYVAVAEGVPQGRDDAVEARAYPIDQLPEDIVFDRRRIISDFQLYTDGFLE